MKTRIAFAGMLFLTTAMTWPAQASPEFMAYEGRNSIHEGQGGERKSVGGIDFWMRGDPPRRFQVLGSLTDERHKTGLWGAIRMAGLEDDIVKATKAAGGDAVILDGEGDEVTGVVGSAFGNANGSFGSGSFNANGSSFGFRRETKQHNSRYIVIRYLPDVPAESATSPAMVSPNNAVSAPTGEVGR